MTGVRTDIAVVNETSRHTWDTPITLINKPWLKKNAVLCLAFPPAMFFAKAAVCLLYLRIFDMMVWIRYTTRVMLFVLFGAYFSMMPVYILYAFPYGSDEQWDYTLSAKMMNKLSVLAIFAGAFNVATDIILLSLPVPIVMKLSLSLEKRIGLAAVFLAGIVATLTTALGLYYRISMYLSKKNMNSVAHGDAMWAAAKTYIIV